jgi:hypothetical protein
MIWQGHEKSQASRIDAWHFEEILNSESNLTSYRALAPEIPTGAND